jgi:hypothetical protein
MWPVDHRRRSLTLANHIMAAIKRNASNEGPVEFVGMDQSWTGSGPAPSKEWSRSNPYVN